MKYSQKMSVKEVVLVVIAVAVALYIIMPLWTSHSDSLDGVWGNGATLSNVRGDGEEGEERIFIELTGDRITMRHEWAMYVQGIATNEMLSRGGFLVFDSPYMLAGTGEIWMPVDGVEYRVSGGTGLWLTDGRMGHRSWIYETWQGIFSINGDKILIQWQHMDYMLEYDFYHNPYHKSMMIGNDRPWFLKLQ